MHLKLSNDKWLYTHGLQTARRREANYICKWDAFVCCAALFGRQDQSEKNDEVVFRHLKYNIGYTIFSITTWNNNKNCKRSLWMSVCIIFWIPQILTSGRGDGYLYIRRGKRGCKLPFLLPHFSELPWGPHPHISFAICFEPMKNKCMNNSRAIFNLSSEASHVFQNEAKIMCKCAKGGSSRTCFETLFWKSVSNS